jgi:outer membrane immunogenic protein
MPKHFLCLILLSVVAGTVMAGPEAESTPVSLARYDWSGAYVGANLGVIWSGSELNANHTNFISDTGSYHHNSSPAEVNPGLQFGYLRQLANQWVLGGEADFTYPSSTNRLTSLNSTGAQFERFTVRNDLQGSLRLRAGYAFGRFLPFITTGVSFGSLGLSYVNDTHIAYDKTTTQTGWVVGGGLEYGVLDHLSARLEYLYTDYGDALNLGLPVIAGTTDPAGSAHVNLHSHVLRAAINYRF